MQDIQALLPASEDSILALDLETNGTDFSDPDCRIVSIGFADRHGCFALSWSGLSDPAREYLFAELRRRPLTSFNVLFDGGFLWQEGLGWLNWSMCSFGLFRQLATEGHEGQAWNLGVFERDVLGWDTSNKDALFSLLFKHGLTKDTMSQLLDLEPEEFLRYNALDAEAHLQAFEVLADHIAEMGAIGATLKRYHTTDFLTEVKLLIEQQIRGITLDAPQCAAYRDTLTRAIDVGLTEFLTHPETAPHIAEYNAAMVAQLLGKEPTKMTVKGEISKNWIKWNEKVNQSADVNYFNPGSTKQMAWLFYDKLGYPVKKFTDTGGRSTDRECLPFLGPAGKALSLVKKKEKELTYVEAGLAKQRDTIIHAQMKSVGAVTGRLSGGYEDV